jgi:hypothetical protein
MTQEEMERTMQFIVEQQAKNAVGIDELKEAQVRTTANIEAMSNNIEAMSKGVGILSRNLGELTGIVASLTDSVRTMEVQVEVDRKEFREKLEFLRAETRETLDIDRKEFRENLEFMRTETREAFDKLILSNEITRDLANKIGELAVNTSRRVSRLESEVFPETSS